MFVDESLSRTELFKTDYSSYIEVQNFTSPEQCEMSINTWVKNESNNLITDLVSHGNTLFISQPYIYTYMPMYNRISVRLSDFYKKKK